MHAHQISSTCRQPRLPIADPVGTQTISIGTSFFAAVEEAIELFSPAPLSVCDRVHSFSSALLAAAKLHVGKSKAGRYTKPWSSPELRKAIKMRKALRRMITDNRAECLEACATTRKLPGEDCQKKREEFLDDLENNLGLART